MCVRRKVKRESEREREKKQPQTKKKKKERTVIFGESVFLHFKQRRVNFSRVIETPHTRTNHQISYINNVCGWD